MDVFLAAGAVYLLYKGTQPHPSTKIPPNKHAVGRLLDRSYTPLGVTHLNHPDANSVSHQTKFSEQYLSKYAQSRRTLRRSTPDKLSTHLTKRNMRSTPARGQFLHDAVSLHTYTRPYEEEVGVISLERGTNVNYSKILV